MRAGPPRAWLRLLERLLPGGVAGQSIVGDLVEEWHRRDVGVGRRIWFALASIRLVAGYAVVGAAAWLRAFGRSAGDALRTALRGPVQAGFTILALGVGIAAPATMFSIADGFTGEIELEEPDRVIHVGRRFTPGVIGVAPLRWLWPELTEVGELESVGVYRRGWADLSGREGPARRLEVAWVTPGAFTAFGVGPALGRTFTPGEADGGSPSVVVSWSLWQNHFGGDRSLLGRSLRLNGVTRTVVGVMPEGFAYPGGVDLWVPLEVDEAALSGADDYQAVGRLAPGASIEGLRERIRGLDAALRAGGEELGAGTGLAAQPWRYKMVSAEDRRLLTLLVVVVSFVLFIACADVLNLLLARALSRSGETAVRVALGAGRATIVGRHLADALVLSILGGLVALGLTAGAIHVFETRAAGHVAHWMHVQLDVQVFLFGFAMVMLAALVTGVVPAVQASRVDPGPTLRAGGRGASAFRIGRFGRGLVAAEVALSCALLVTSGLIVRSALSELEVEGDFATETVLTARYELRTRAYDEEAVPAFHRRLLRELGDDPGVADAAVASNLPGTFAARSAVEVEGSGGGVDRGALPHTGVVSVSPSFFSTVESRVLRGRGLTWRDLETGSGAVLVDEDFVRRHLSEVDPLGARIRLVSLRLGADDPDPTRPWLTVVGVVPSLGYSSGGRTGSSTLYVPLSGLRARRAAVLIRGAPGTDPLDLAPKVGGLVSELDPDLALWEVDTLAGRLEASGVVASVMAGLFLTFGVAGVLLAGVGLYGLLAFTVRVRLRELGIRSALGAKPLRVLGGAVGGGMLYLAFGMAAGLGLAAVVTPALGPELTGGSPHDPLVFGVVTGVLGVTGLVASAFPARRVLSLDVVEVLRTE